MLNTIIDIYWGNSKAEPEKAKAAGVVAIIHKASEGVNIPNNENDSKKYPDRRDKALELGLLWGAYHLISNQDPQQQVDWFLSKVGPLDDTTLYALDWESEEGHQKIEVDQVRKVVAAFYATTGRYPMLYGGNSVRSGVGNVRDELLANCPLWYIWLEAAVDKIPTATWPTYTLWQYNDGKFHPKQTPAPNDTLGEVDWNVFDGTLEELKAQWPFKRT